MATHFKVPASPKRDIIEIDNFLGVDLTNTGSNISEMRSPYAPNMIRDVPGKVRKRMGYKVEKDFCEDEIVDNISYKSVPLFLANTFPYTQAVAKWQRIAILIGTPIPKGQKFSIRLQYSTEDDYCFLTVGGYQYGSGRYPLQNTQGNIKTIIINSDELEDVEHVGAIFTHTATGELTIYDLDVAYVSNNRQFDDSAYEEEELDANIDDLFVETSPIKNILVDSDTSSMAETKKIPLNKQVIGEAGLKRIEYRLKIDDSLAPISWTTTNILFGFNNEDTNDFYTLGRKATSTAALRQGETFVFYAHSDFLNDMYYISRPSWSSVDNSVLITAELLIQDADYKNFATLRPVNDVPVYGAHTIKNTNTIDGETLYRKNRLKRNFLSGESIHETLEANSNGSTRYLFEDCFIEAEEIAYYIEYSATEDFYLKFESTGQTAYIFLKKGENVKKQAYYKPTVSTISWLRLYGGSNNSSVTITRFAIYHQAKEEQIPINEVVYTQAPELVGETFNVSDLYRVSSNETQVAGVKSNSTEYYPNESKIYYMTFATQELDRVIPKDTAYKVSFSFTVNSVENVDKIIDLFASIRATYNGGVRRYDIASKTGVINVGNTYFFEGITKIVSDSTYTKMELNIGQMEIDFSSVGKKSTVNWTIGEVKIAEAQEKSKFLVNDENSIIHVGKELYLQDGLNYKLLYSNMNSARSNYWQLENNVYIADGNKFLVYDSATEKVQEVYGAESTYVPTLTIAKPTQKGTSANATQYEAINLLNPAFKERFTSYGDTETYTVCQMSRAPLDADSKVKAWVMDSQGNMVEKTQGTHFSVNYGTATITFNYRISDADGNVPLTGEDNIIIQASRTPEGYKDRINKCRFGALFGVNGASDRLFLSGNPNYINYDWYSGYYDFTYFPDDGYAKLGLDSSAIIGYSIINNYLAAHKDKNEPTQGVIIREGDLIENKPAFKIINTLQGEGAIAPHSFAYLETEPLFLTRNGVFAITASDVTGEKYSQNRSFYVNGELTKETGMSEACAIIHNDMYWLFINDKAYVLDGLQSTRTDKSEPYATRQYVGFLLTNLPVYVAWENNDTLWFGTKDGKVCRFYNDVTSPESYNDNGEPIEAWWETPDLDGKLFYKNKTFRYIAVRLKSNIKTGAKLYSQVRGIWTLFKNCRNITNIVFMFSEIIFSEFTFNHDISDKVVSSKLRVKKIDKARFKIENSELNEPFGIQNVAFEYVENGNFKG